MTDAQTARLKEIQEALQGVLAHRDGRRIPVSSSDDEVDALSTSINALLDTLENETHELRVLSVELDQIFETRGDAVLRVDANGNIGRANAALHALTGHTPESVVGKPLASLYATATDANAAIDESRKFGVADDDDATLVSTSGELVSAAIRLSAATLPDDGGVHLVWVARDTRAIRKLVEAHARLDAERARADDINNQRTMLQSALEELSSTQDQLLHAQKMEAIGQLAGGIAHDFNNLLLVILSHASFLEEKVFDEEGKADLQQLESAASSARDLTARLLAFSRKQPTTTNTVDVNNVIDHAYRMLRPTLGSRITLTMELSSRVNPVVIDPAQLEQVLVNLVVNARDAMPRGGRIMVRTEPVPHDDLRRARAIDVTDGELMAVVVEDTGDGMPPEVLARAFEPFYTTKPRGKGTGLGLAMCYSIVKSAGGAILVDTEPKNGTTFSILLPCDDQTTTTASSVRAPTPRLPRGTETVLVVEDQSDVRLVFKKTLAALGYNVLLASDGEEALQFLHPIETRVDLVITDAEMPRLAGEVLIKRIEERQLSIPVIFVTGHAHRQPETQRDDVRVLRKPFSPPELAAAVRDVLDRR